MCVCVCVCMYVCVYVCLYVTIAHLIAVLHCRILLEKEKINLLDIMNIIFKKKIILNQKRHNICEMVKKC